MEVRFTVPGAVRGKGRPRFGRGGGGHVVTFTDSKTVSYENLIKAEGHRAMNGRPPLDTPLAILVKARITPPVSASKKRREEMLAGKRHPATRPDCDNILKALLDGLNKVVFTDDARIVGISFWKVYADTAGLDVKISEIDT